MPHIEPRTQQAVMNPHPWAMYSKQPRTKVPCRFSKTSPADEAILQMAEWYADLQFGALAVESDSFDRTFTF